MQRKQLVKRKGKWAEEWVDCGPAKPNTMSHIKHPVNRRLNGKRWTGRHG